MAGDITMAAPRRLLAETMAKYEKSVYSYRWDVAALNETSNIGVNHFSEVRRQHSSLPDQMLTILFIIDTFHLREPGPEHHKIRGRPCSSGSRESGCTHVDVICGGLGSKWTRRYFLHLYEGHSMFFLTLTSTQYPEMVTISGEVQLEFN